jgi:SET domain
MGSFSMTKSISTNNTHVLPAFCADPLDWKEGSGGHHNQLEEDNDECSLKEKTCVYGATSVILILLERWLEFGDRPNESLLRQMWTVLDDKNLQDTVTQLCLNPVDDLKELKKLVHNVRRLLWTRAMPPAEDPHLHVKASHIPKAQLGLFAAQTLPAHTVCCYLSGDVHSAKSSQSKEMLSDASYLLRVGGTPSQPWWYSALASSSNQDYKVFQEEWDALGRTMSSEIFVDPTHPNIKARYMNDCLCDELYNVQFVWDPAGERAAVVTLREIEAGEELYVSYGPAYWESLEATTGIVPQKLPASDNPTLCLEDER